MEEIICVGTAMPQLYFIAAIGLGLAPLKTRHVLEPRAHELVLHPKAFTNKHTADSVLINTAWLQVTIEHCLVSALQEFSSMNEADNLLKSSGNTQRSA